jgi:hypothetical protein
MAAFPTVGSAGIAVRRTACTGLSGDWKRNAAAGGGVGHRRAPARPEAGLPPGVGTGATASSCWCSTMRAGTPSQASPCRTASGSSICHPIPRSCNRPSGCGRSSASPLSTSISINQRPRCRPRRALLYPLSTPRIDRRSHQFPLVAKTHHPELIIRIWCEMGVSLACSHPAGRTRVGAGRGPGSGCR